MKYSDFIKKINEFPFPVSTVDIVIECDGGIVLIKRKYEPIEWALPGGFVEKGESVETAAAREAKEETSLDIYDLNLIDVFSEPGRDERFASISIAFSAKGKGALKAKSDAKEIGIFSKKEMPGNLAFDHNKIVEKYFRVDN